MQTCDLRPHHMVLCGCVQLRQTAEFTSAHGGRVCWDESTLSFAMAVDEELDRVNEEVRLLKDAPHDLNHAYVVLQHPRASLTVALVGELASRY